MASKLLGADDATGTNQNTGYFLLTKFQAEASGTMTEFRIKSGVSGNVKCAIYADNAGEPGDLITAMNTGQAVTGGQWNTLNFTSTDIVSGTYYWLGICFDTNGNAQWINGGAACWKAATYATFAFPNPAGSGFSSGAYTYLTAGWGGLAISLAGGSSGVAAVSGLTAVNYALAGITQGVASVAASCSLIKYLSGLVTGLATVTGALWSGKKQALRTLDAIRNLTAVRNLSPTR